MVTLYLSLLVFSLSNVAVSGLVFYHNQMLQYVRCCRVWPSILSQTKYLTDNKQQTTQSRSVSCYEYYIPGFIVGIRA